MTKCLNKDLRRRIANRATQEAREKAADEFRDKESDLAVRGHAFLFSEETMRLVMTAPKMFLMFDGCLRFNANGWDLTFHLKGGMRLPVPADANRRYGCTPIGSITGELATEMQAFSLEKKKFDERNDEITKAVMGVLDSCRTFKRLREVWPEGLPYYKDYDTDVPSLPVVQVARINELLGLPKEEVVAEGEAVE